MAIVVNKNTTQQPMSQVGKTLAQSIRLIAAPRVYVKAPDSTASAPVQLYYTKSNGVTPTGWTDLGIVQGLAKISYTKKVAEVKTGLDDYLRAAYTQSKEGQIEFSLGQLDDVVLEQISGLTASQITSNSVYNYQIGQEDLNSLALMLVVQNKLDGKEWQFYHPSVLFNFAFEDQNDAMMLKATGILPFFTANGQTKESILSTTIYA